MRFRDLYLILSGLMYYSKMVGLAFYMPTANLKISKIVAVWSREGWSEIEIEYDTLLLTHSFCG